MGKFKSWKYRSLFTNICTSTCLVGASAGVIFGVSAGTFKINYVNLADTIARANAANGKYSYYSQDIKSQWDMVDGWNPNSKTVDDAKAIAGTSLWDPSKGETWWGKLHNGAKKLTEGTTDMELGKKFGEAYTNASTAINARYNYISMVIDGSTHTTMDRSFNQSLYNGLVNFIKNKSVNTNDLAQETESDPVGKNCAKSFKPGGDNTTEFLNIFKTVASKYRLTGLAGFNHVTPLNAMGTYGNGETGDKSDKGAATNYRVKFDANNSQFDAAGFLLIDGEVANNQQVASVLFRSDQPGFLAALSTCMYFYNNLDTYHDKFQTLSVGAYGGTSIPTVTIYMGGFERGVEFFNEFVLKQGILGDTELKKVIDGETINNYPDLKKLVDASKNKEDIYKAITAKSHYTDVRNALYDEYAVKMIKLGDPSTHFSGTFASGDAIGITKQFLNRGASAIIAVAGPQSLDSAQEIQNQNSKCIVVGVDSAMEEGDYQRSFKASKYTDKTVCPDSSEANQKGKIIKFSAVKDMTTVTQKWAQLSAEGKNFDVEGEDAGGQKTGQPDPNKAICGIGYKTCGNIQNGLISISWDGWAPFLQAMRHTHGYTYGTDVNKTFDFVFNKVATEYVTNGEGKGLAEEFKNACKNTNLNALQTFDKNSNKIYANYNHLMIILGDVLNNSTLTFPKEMNVKDSGQKTKDGATIWAAAEDSQDLNILAWLKQNMFFI